ncbi:MAG: histidine triad nucleotide-binding protein [Akkermansiaceae bacterium]|jgi:histidine triad (HIT) family protein
MSTEPTLFEKIIAREIPADIIYEDDLCLCFRDIAPQAPVHLLLIPKKPITRIALAGSEDLDLLGHLMLKVGEIARQEGYAEEGFRVVINNGKNGGEAVPHLHLHLLAGRPLKWPPG